MTATQARMLKAEDAAAMLAARDNILILSHAKPDGDTLGSACALLLALEELGKTARMECADPVPNKYRFICPDYIPKEFEPSFVVAVDTADLRLLGALGEKHKGRIGLCIDHHKSNAGYADSTLLDVSAAAAGEVVYRVIRALGVVPCKAAANALFTAITTDTGGFRYADVSAETHRIAAELIELGAEHAEINRMIFETKSRGRIETERLMLETMEFHFGGACAVITVPRDIKTRLGINEDDLDGISSMPRTIEGVFAGVTLRDQEDESGCRVSVRSTSPADASAICAELGGGGHANAAGATVAGEAGAARAFVLAAVGRELARKGIITQLTVDN